MDTKTINAAVKANMEALKDILANAAELASEGHGYMVEDNHNGAIGTIADLAGQSLLNWLCCPDQVEHIFVVPSCPFKFTSHRSF